MTKDGILNAALCRAIAACGHTDYFMIADCGLPLPDGVEVIDLSLTRGIPHFTEALAAVNRELVVESYVLASETETVSPALHQEIQKIMGELPCKTVSHEQLKEMSKNAKVIVRTGETTPFANIILECGVNF